MTNEKELRDWREELYQAFHNMPSGVDKRTEKFHEIAKIIDSEFHSHTKEVVEKIGSDLSYALYNLKNSIKHEREGTNIHGHENDLDRDLQALDDLLASLEDNKPTEELLGKNAVIDYANDYSHYHCWNQTQPSACGIPLEKHTQCCLCGQIYEDNKK